MPAGATEFLGRAIIILVVIVVTIMITVPMIRDTNNTLFNFNKDKDDNDLISVVASRDVYAREMTKQLTDQISSIQNNGYSFDEETQDVLNNYFIAYGIMFDEDSKKQSPVVINLKKEKKRQQLDLNNACFYFNNSKLTDLEINNKKYEKNYIDVVDTWFYDSELFTKTTNNYFGSDIYVVPNKLGIFPEDFNPENFAFKDGLDIMCITYIVDQNKDPFFSNKHYYPEGNCYINYDGIQFVYYDQSVKNSEGDCESLLKQEEESYNKLVTRFESLLNNNYDLFYTLNLSESKDLKRSMLVYGYYNDAGTVKSAVLRLRKENYGLIRREDDGFVDDLKYNLQIKNSSEKLELVNLPSFILEDFKIINNDTLVIVDRIIPITSSIPEDYFNPVFSVHAGNDPFLFTHSKYHYLDLFNMTRIIEDRSEYFVTKDWQFYVSDSSKNSDFYYALLHCDPYSFIKKSDEESRIEIINFMERKDTHLFNEYYNDLKSAFIMNDLQKYNLLNANDYVFLRSIPIYGYYNNEPMLILFYAEDEYDNYELYQELHGDFLDKYFSINITCQDSAIATENNMMKCKQTSVDYFKEDIMLIKMNNYLVSVTDLNALSFFVQLKKAMPSISQDSFYPILTLARKEDKHESREKSCSGDLYTTKFMRFIIRNLNDVKDNHEIYLFEKFNYETENCYFKYEENNLFVSLFEPSNKDYSLECEDLIRRDDNIYNVLVNKFESLLNDDGLFYTLNLSESKDLKRSMLVYGLYNDSYSLKSAVMRLIKKDYAPWKNFAYGVNTVITPFVSEISKFDLNEYTNLNNYLALDNYAVIDFKIIDEDSKILGKESMKNDTSESYLRNAKLNLKDTINVNEEYFIPIILVVSSDSSQDLNARIITYDIVLCGDELQENIIHNTVNLTRIKMIEVTETHPVSGRTRTTEKYTYGNDWFIDCNDSNSISFNYKNYFDEFINNSTEELKQKINEIN